MPAIIPGSGVIKMDRLVLGLSTRMRLRFGPGGHANLYEAHTMRSFGPGPGASPWT